MERRTFLTAAAATPILAAGAGATTPELFITEQMQVHVDKLFALAKRSVPEGMEFTQLNVLKAKDSSLGTVSVIAKDNGEGLNQRTGYLHFMDTTKWNIYTKGEFRDKFYSRPTSNKVGV